MAASIFFLAWPFFKDGKWIQWYVASAIAFLFHVSAFVLFLLPLICLPGIRNIFVFGKRTIIVGIVILVVGYAIQSMFFDLIRAVAVTDSMAERAQTYNKSSLGVSQWNIGGMLLHSMRYLVYPIVMMYFLKKKGERTINVFPDTNGRWQAMVMMSIYISFFTLFITIVLRYTNYFFLFVIITMSDWTFSKVRLFGKTYALQFGYWIVFFIPMLWADAQSEYFGAINKSGTLRQYMVYYPYSSCFDQSRDVNREKCYKYYSVYRD